MIERVIVGDYQSWALTGTRTPHQDALERASRSILSMWHAHFLHNMVPASEHIPDLETPEGVRQFLSLCAYRELINICTTNAYSHEDFTKALTTDERRMYIDARRTSRKLLDWFFRNFKLIGTQDNLRGIYFKYLAGVAKCLLFHRAEYGSHEIPYERINTLISETFEGHEDFSRAYNSDDEASRSYGFPLLQYTITRAAEPEAQPESRTFSGYHIWLAF